jgi:hypothetical protein
MTRSEASAPSRSVLDELRGQYELSRQQAAVAPHAEGFHEIDERLRKAFRWLEKAISYLDELKPPLAHRFDLGHGLLFESPRFARGSVTQHEQRIVGYPVLDEIKLYYEIAAAKPLAIDVAPALLQAVEKTLDDAGLQYTSRRLEAHDGTTRSCALAVPPSIPAAVLFKADYRTGLVTAALFNVDRLDRITLEFHSEAIEEPVLEDLVRLILGRDTAFLHRAPLAGLHRPAP